MWLIPLSIIIIMGTPAVHYWFFRLYVSAELRNAWWATILTTASSRYLSLIYLLIPFLMKPQCASFLGIGIAGSSGLLSERSGRNASPVQIIGINFHIAIVAFQATLIVYCTVTAQIERGLSRSSFILLNTLGSYHSISLFQSLPDISLVSP